MLTQELLKELLHYDPDTGVFTWITSSRHARRRGIAGCLSHGYYKVHVDNRMYFAHRLAWLYMTGAWPTNQIDHVDLNRANNSWTNLREATQSQNVANRRVRSDSYLGIKGIEKRHNRFRAKIVVDGRRYDLGNFDTPEEAHAAYASALKRFHGEFARAS